MELPPTTKGLLDLFHGPLRDVRFPDADVERLELAIVAARDAAVAVAHAEASLAAAREALADKERGIRAETERALAYVRVYATERPELRASLEAMTARAPAARRGRPRKTRAPEEDEAAAAE